MSFTHINITVLFTSLIVSLFLATACATTKMVVRSPSLVEMRFRLVTGDGQATEGVLLATNEKRVSCGDGGPTAPCRHLLSAPPWKAVFTRGSGGLEDIRGGGEFMEVVAENGVVNVAAAPTGYSLSESVVGGWKQSGEAVVPYNPYWPLARAAGAMAIDSQLEIDLVTPFSNVEYVANETDFGLLTGLLVSLGAMVPLAVGLISCIGGCDSSLYYSAGAMGLGLGLIWLSSETDWMVYKSIMYQSDK